MPVLGFNLKNFYTSHDFPWLTELEKYGPEIKEEFILKTTIQDTPTVQELDKNLLELTTDNGWKAVLLSNYSGPTNNASNYPTTMHAISKIPAVVSAAFSILEPHKNLPLHRGPYRGILFVHLGVVVPLPVSSITFIVNGEKRNWKEGEAFAFEDSYYHEVQNLSHSYRAILLLEIIRNDVPALLFPIHRWIIRQLKQK